MAFSLRPLQPEIYPAGTFRIPREDCVFRVGRDEGNDLCVDHSSVSAAHARLEVVGEEGVEVIDCGSSNGTFVNGIRVERRRLADGDLLRFASAEFRVVGATNGSMLAPHDLDEDEFQDLNESIPPVEEETVPISIVESQRETLLRQFDEEREVWARDLEQNRDESARLRVECGVVRANFDRRDAEAILLEAEVKSHQEQIRRLERDLDEAAQREQRIQANLSEARREVIAREGVIAGLRYEIGTKDGQIRQLEEQRARLQQICDDYATVHEELRNALSATTADLESTAAARDEAQGVARDLLARLDTLGGRLLSDWQFWIPRDEDASNDVSADGIFERLEGTAAKIRSELDHIEPIWGEFGDGVQNELSRRCDEWRREEASLEAETLARRDDLAAVEADLAQFRELMDVEVRRAQGLSRRGIEVEIPERFESMVIARDREQEIYRALIERIEVLDLLLGGYRRSRKLAEVAREISEFRNRLSAILESGGVRLYEVEIGTFLNPKHRREVQVLSRKGWGTKQYAEYPFQPGEVTKVIRPGYRVGEGDSAVILRKVEVLIRGVDD